MGTPSQTGDMADAPGFDTLAINLDRDAARLAGVMASCAAVGIQAERLPALTPDTLPARMRPWFYTSDGRPRGGLLPGEIGCYASHLLAMEIAVARNRPILVLEDDAVLSPSMARVNEMIAAAPEDWGLLRMSCLAKHMCLRVGQGDGFDIVRYWRGPNMTAAYAVSPEGARRFLADFDVRTRPVDEDMRREWLHGAPVYGVAPSPVRQQGAPSSIATQEARDQLNRKQAMGRMGGLDAWVWRLSAWGAIGVAACVGHSLLWSLRKRMGRRPTESELVMDPPLSRRR